MKTLSFIFVLCVAMDNATAQTSAFHSFTPPPMGSDIVWPASILDTQSLSYNPPFYSGFVRIENQTNNPIFFNDDYVATGNSPLIDGNAMWGDARAGFPLGDPELTLQFDEFFLIDGETGDPIDEVLEVSFDFAWASSEPNVSIDTLEIEIEDYSGNTETIIVDLNDTFQHSLGGTGQGHTGQVTVIPDLVDNIYLIRILNLRNGNTGGYINQWAIDNLSVGGALPPGSELGVVEFDGQPASNYGTNVLKNTGTFGISKSIFNGTSTATNFSVLWSSNNPAMYQPVPKINVPIAPGATSFNAVTWEMNTETALSGEYNGEFTITNNNNPNDPDDTLTVTFFRLYDAPSLTDNSGSTLSAPGGQATLSNAAASGHLGALRASVRVTQVLQSNARFSVSGVTAGSAVNPGNTLTGTVSYQSAGSPSGQQNGQMRVKLEMFGSPETYLNDRTPVADRIWPLTFNVPVVLTATPSVTSGQELAGVGLAISGEQSGAAVIGGVSPSDQSVALAFETSPPAPNPIGVGQAIGLEFGVSPGLYVLQLAYADLAPGYAEQDLRVHAHTVPSGPWVPAISLNGNGGATVIGATPYLGTYAGYLTELGGNTLDASDLGAFGIDTASNTAWVVLDYDGTFQLVTGPNTAPPQILGITYDKISNTSTITYQSLTGETFGVSGGEDLTGLDLIGTTVVGTGAVMQYQHNPPGAPARYFYQIFRSYP